MEGAVLKRLAQSFWAKRALEFAFLLSGIILIAYFIQTVLGYWLLDDMNKSVNYAVKGINTEIKPSIDHFLTYLNAVFHPSEIKIQMGYGFRTKEYPFTEFIQGMYQTSMTLLLISILATILLGVVLSYIFIMAGKRIKKILESTAILIESIPDLMWIYLFILFFIWFFRTTGWEPFELITYNEQAWVGPVVCMSIVPVIQSFRMMILFTKQELSKMYVEYAFSRGFSKSYIVTRHVLRNILNNVLSQFSLLYIFILSSLFLVENVFNVRGIMSFFLEMQSKYTGPEIFCLWMIMLFIPFYLIRSLFEYLVYRTLGVEAYE